ncbi:alpha/beta hydrolase family protein [Ornithinimicrobium sufpigmenti]|uniref:alpha/beta hydrolase family protein n=1 Tax=Ornithinimicrobium sufpigmenti TaxID=2508882 RepID=UPI0015E1AA75|nr:MULTISPECIES: alpha/beta fold hydrolase [unclassified Ornithinimicrobium]
MSRVAQVLAGAGGGAAGKLPRGRQGGRQAAKKNSSSELGSSLGRAAVAGISAAAGAAVGGAVSMGTATYFAHRIITPEHEKKDDTAILDVDEDAGTVTFRATPWTSAPGRYGLWLDRGAGHARVGQVLAEDHELKPPTVTRELLGVDQGELAPGPARWNKYFFCGTPGSALGLDYEDVVVTSDIGDLGAWRVPPQEGTDNGDWAVLVHGRSAMREETLRAVPVLHRLGYTTLIPMYRNDIGAPASSDGRYSLGMAEWRDVDAALRYALAHGARRLVLVGWSMGGAIVLQALNRSDVAHRVHRVILNGPVIDWGNVLAHQADLHFIPRPIDHLARSLLRSRLSRHLLGIAEPVDVAATNWVDRADEVTHRIFIIHSATDETVPYGPSQDLARRRPGLVHTFVWPRSRHCQEWNTNPSLWDDLVASFLR